MTRVRSVPGRGAGPTFFVSRRAATLASTKGGLHAGDVTVASEPLVDRLRDVLHARAEVQEAYLFGSQARSEGYGHSDVDVAVRVDTERLPDAPWGYAAELTAELMAALGTNRIDLVVLNSAPPLLYGRVLRDGVRLLARDLRATTAREGHALSRFCDYLPQLAKIEAAHRARIAAEEFGR